MPEEASFILKDQNRIQSTIRSLMEKHQLVTVYPADSDQSSITVVSDIKEEDGCFCLNAVSNGSIHGKIANGSAFTLKTSIDGVEVSARRLVASNVIGDTENLMYRLPIPSKLYHYEKRNNHRESVPGAAGIKTSVLIPNPGSNTGHYIFDDCDLFNISKAGCAISMTDSGGQFVSEYEKPLFLEFGVETWNDDLRITALKKHHRYLERTSQWQIGFQFLNTRPEAQHRFERLLAGLELLNRQMINRSS